MVMDGKVQDSKPSSTNQFEASACTTSTYIPLAKQGRHKTEPTAEVQAPTICLQQQKLQNHLADGIHVRLLEFYLGQVFSIPQMLWMLFKTLDQICVSQCMKSSPPVAHSTILGGT